MSKKLTGINDINFEEALKELEAIVDTLGTGELTLEASLKNFEKGISLASQCQEALKKTEQKVQQLLITQNGEYKTTPFIEEE